MSLRPAIGVLVGAVADIGLTVILSTLLFFNRIPAANLSGDEYERAVEQALLDNPILFASQLLLGSTCSVLGGYVAARIARRGELLNGGLSSFLCVGFGVQSLYVGKSLLPLWFHILWLPITPALAVLGGYICLRRKRANPDT
jgi:CHASE2 domain-containing sensor protein